MTAVENTDKQAYQIIAEDIVTQVLSGSLKPGDRLPSERELVKAYNVSRPTVREALRVLQSEGMILSKVGDTRGPVVLPPNGALFEKALSRLANTEYDNPEFILQFRMVIGSAAAALAAFYRTEDELRQLEEAVRKMKKAAGVDGHAFRQADVAFHMVLARASKNPMLEIADQAVRGATLKLMERSLPTEDDGGELASTLILHHEEMVASIRNKDSGRASWLTRNDIYLHYAKLLDEEGRVALKVLADEIRNPNL